MRSALRVLVLLIAIAVAFKLFEAWQDWRAVESLKELSASIKKGMSEQEISNLALPTGVRVQQRGSDELIIRKSGGDLICSIDVAMDNGHAVTSSQPLCID